jgi:hypothetical protein
MVALLPSFADAEQVGLALLQPLTAAETVTATGPQIVPPLIRVQRTGGSDDGLTDFASLEVACFGTDRGNAWVLAEQVRQHILAARATEVVLPGGLSRVTIDNSLTTTPAQQVPWPDPEQRVVVATYEIQMRRPRAA